MRPASALVALLVVATACSGSGTATTSSTAPPPTTTPPTTAPPTTTTTVPAEVGVVAAPVRHPATARSIYMAMADRFDNGDPTNDLGAGGDGPLEHGFLPTDTGYFHGGDIAGLTDRLEYLAGLGVTAVWVTPPFVNRVVQGGGAVGNSSAGYHGYWQVDYTTIDPHLGTDQEMVDFVRAAHERGIAVYFDAVTNHTGDVITYDTGFAYQGKATAPYRDASGVVFDDAEFAGTDAFPPLDAAVSFPKVPRFRSEADAGIKAPDWLDDPIYYHNRGDSTFTGENSLYGDFFGLDDLFTEHPDVVEGMIDIYTRAIDDYGIDGFRVDTVKHVNDEFWAEWVPAILDHAAAAGKDDFFVFGEVFGESPTFRSHYTTVLPFPSLLDFGFNDAALAYAGGAGANVLSGHFGDDDWYTDADSNASMLVKFAGNHDIGRLGMFVTAPGRDDAERLARARLALELMYLSRGVPLVYYGDEQGFVGDGGDQGARQDMFPSRVASYNDDDLIGTDATTADANFDPDHPLYAAIARLGALRVEHPALVTGNQVERWADPEPGVYAFSRIDRDERVEYVVVHNNSTEERSVRFATSTPGGQFNPIYPELAEVVAADEEGNISVTVPPLSTIAWHAEADVPFQEQPLAIRIVRPTDGAELNLPRFRIQADLDRPPTYAEVTFAVSVDGGDFEVVGTDDSPAYRVYWDNRHLPAGTEVTVLATVDDGSGRRATDEVTFTLLERAGA